MPSRCGNASVYAGDNQLAVWDLALERDPEEEAALAQVCA
jgi:hypothetical protein